MEFCSKIQEKHQETKNKSCNNGDIEVPTRTTLSGFLAEKQRSSSCSKLRFNLPISFLKLLQKSSQEREISWKPRKRLTAKISVFLSNAVSCSKPKTNDKSGMPVLNSEGGESRNSGNGREVKSRKVFGIGHKSPLSKACEKNCSREGLTDSGSCSSTISSYNSTEEENFSRVTKSPPLKVCKKNGLGELLNSDSWSSSRVEIEEQMGTRYKFQTDFGAGKLWIPIKKVFESVVVDGKGRKKELCKRRILMGDKCRPLDFSGVIHYDENGNPVQEFPFKRTPSQSPLSQHVKNGAHSGSLGSW